jgi:hypothetical protein
MHHQRDFDADIVAVAEFLGLAMASDDVLSFLFVSIVVSERQKVRFKNLIAASALILALYGEAFPVPLETLSPRLEAGAIF